MKVLDAGHVSNALLLMLLWQVAAYQGAADATSPSDGCLVQLPGLGRATEASGAEGAAPLLPLLVFTCALHELPLRDIYASHAPAVAFPGSSLVSNGASDASLRAALRFGVHVVGPAEAAPSFLSATGQHMLFHEARRGAANAQVAYDTDSPAEQLLEDLRDAVFQVERPLESSPHVLVDDDARNWLRDHSIPSVDTADSQIRATMKPAGVEASFNSSQVHVAYDFWSCDYIGRGEIFHALCQTLRAAYFHLEHIDLFKFIPRGDAESQPHIETEDPRRASDFITANRERVEAAYQRLVSHGWRARAPVKEVVYVLFGIPREAFERTQGESARLSVELRRRGATSRFEDGVSFVSRGQAPLFVGLALVALGVTGLRRSARRASGALPRKPPPGFHRGSVRARRRARRSHVGDEGVIPHFLVSRAQSLSKAM